MAQFGYKRVAFVGLSLIRLRGEKVVQEYTIHGPSQPG